MPIMELAKPREYEIFHVRETPVTEAEIELKENIQKVLLDSIFHYNRSRIIDEEAWGEDNLNSQPQCSNVDEDFDNSYKRRAVEYWRKRDNEENNNDRTRNRSLKSVQHAFKRVSSLRQLRRISQLGSKKVKKSHRIVSRKVTKFVTRRTLEDSVDLQKTTDDFLKAVKPLIEQFGSENIYNSDQSGFQLEIHSGRSLSNEGEKKTERVVQSISSTTHSYTIQPIISCDGKLLSPLFIVLKEIHGRFGPRVEENLFKPINVIAKTSKSGKMTSDHFKMWLEEAYFPNIGSNSVLLIDSWTGHCPNIISDLTPSGKRITTMIIPKGTTGKIQPLDVYGFRIWKNFAKRFSDIVLLLESDINLHERNNIIKLQSLIHNQLSSPRYHNLFKYSWFKSGYTDERLEEFKNPVQFSFDETSTTCDIEDCNNIAVIRCSWCKKSLCLKHFFHEYHYCNEYNESE
ncbi:uncharacterized protein LOC112589848 [Harpegnathos saltator]|uniref:uncharacterized protein LOC112589848 n=1 Tax=Harpegnathos saltator TaxID=610380 RepID=UPI000DBEEDFF|nr:uncharacterized protein LOC112589848 [Harpegnathos saltator]